MSWRDWGNVPLFSTTAATQTNPSTATLVAQLILPSPGSTNVPSQYEVRYIIGGDTRASWTLEVATGSGLADSAIRKSDNDATNALQRSIVFTQTGQTSEFVHTVKAYPGDRIRIRPYAAITGEVAGSIQAEALT